MHSFRIGKVFGIDLNVDSSWVFILLLLTWNLSSALAGWHPDWPVFESIAIALTASLLFFACIVIHELAHSLVARRYGLDVRSITLFLFGGISDVEREPPSPRAEFFTAIAGPIASLLVGLGFLLFGLLGFHVLPTDARAAWHGLARLGPVVTLLVWLAPINLIIGAFNLVPAFPMDGGRVLRAILWAASGDLRISTRRVSAIGNVFGWMFIVAGLAVAFGPPVVFAVTGLVGGLWLAFIGWFLHSAASRSSKRTAIHDAFAGHTVQEIMRRGGPTVAPELPLAELVHDYLVQSSDRAFPVVRDGKLVGLVSLSNVRGVPAADWAATAVAKVMRAHDSLVVATPDEPLADAFDQLARQDLRQLPVLDRGRLVGMLQRRDVTRWLELAWGAALVPKPDVVRRRNR